MHPESVRVPGRVDFANAPAVLASLAASLDAKARAFDLSGCTEFDSSLLAVLLDLDRRARAAGGVRCRWLNPPAKLRKLAVLYGIDGILFDQRD